MIRHKRNPVAPNGWSDRSSIAHVEKPGGGKRAKEEQLAAVVLNTRRNQARLAKALEAGNTDRGTVLASLVAKGIADAKRLATELEDAGRLTFAKAKTATAMRPIILWAKGEQEATVAETGKAVLPSLPKAHTSIGKADKPIPVLTLAPSAGPVAKPVQPAKRKIRKAKIRS